jgi:kynurenine formamidase
VVPIFRRGVLLDVARVVGVEALAEDFEILPEHLDAASKVKLRTGDVALLRTGWARYWHDAGRYVNETRGPGPALEGAKWLSARGVFAAGADTVAFEKLPDASMPVHVHLLVEKGIHIIECLNLEALSQAGVEEFWFVALPLKLQGATGSPVRPVAIAS